MHNLLRNHQEDGRVLEIDEKTTAGEEVNPLQFISEFVLTKFENTEDKIIDDMVGL